HAFLQASWRARGIAANDTAWDAAVRDGVAVTDTAAPQPPPPRPLDLPALARAWSPPATRAGGSGDDELVLYPSVALHDGTGATPNNGWLQELPDPISKLTWSNALALAPARAAA